MVGAGLWAVLGLVGGWFLLTGRKTIYGLPKAIAEGWPLRVWGAAYLGLAAFLIYQAFRDSFSPSGIATTYILLVLALMLVLNRRRTTTGAGTAGRV